MRRITHTLLFSLLIQLLALGIFVPSAKAADVIDVNNANLSFTSKTFIVGNGRANNDIVRFNSVYTSGSNVVDAVVKTNIVAHTAGSDTPTITDYDPASTEAGFLDLDVGGPSSSSFNGYINLEFSFFKGGTYTGPGTGTPITLNNVRIYSLDIDSGDQFTDFKGFQRYYVNRSSRLRIGNNIPSTPVDLRTTSPFFRFLSGDGASGNNDPRDSVMVDYLTVSTMDIRVGNAKRDGGAYFAIGFGTLNNLDSTGSLDNPANTAPTSSNYSLNVPETGTVLMETRYFGNFQDADGNPFDKVRITALPTSGTLQKLTNGNWVNVSLNDYVAVSAIGSGELRLVMNSSNGTTDNSFKFKVNDSLSDSIEYTLTLNVRLTPQTIAFVNPETRTINTVVTDTATASSQLPVTIVSSTPGVCTVSNGTIVNTGTEGFCTITATQDGNSTFAVAPTVVRTFLFQAVQSQSQTITFAQPDSKFVGDSFASNATASSGLTVTLASGNANICTVSGLNITAVATGSCVITASQSGGTNNGTTFSAATNVSRTFTIGDRPIVIPTNAIFFDANTGTGFMNPQYGVTGSLLTLDRNTLTKTGFRFVGWNLRADGSGISFRDGQAIALTSDIRLFAQWEFIRKTPTVTWVDPAPINNKTPLSGVQLNATSATPGTYVYSPAAGTLLAPGKQKLKVVFTPTDIINFEPITLEVEITVIEQRLPVISWANPEEIIFGTLISATQLNASASVDGSFDYGNQRGFLLPVGTHTLTVNFKPRDALNFADIKATVSIVVLEKLEPKANILITPYQTTGESKVLGVNAGTTLVVLERGPGISSSRVNGDIVTVVPRPGFAGETSLELRATLGKQVVEFDKTVRVLPATPSGATMRVVDFNNTQLDWNLVSSAIKYEATLNGQILCTSDTSSCIANKLLGPKSDVKVVAIASGELKSGEGDVQYLSPESPVIAKIENFATASFRLNAKAKRELREFAAEVRELGFTRLQVQGHTDIRGGVDNTVLSRNRAQQTIKFLQRLLPEVQFKVGYFASTRPLADNSTREGLAANRRVEIAIW